MLADALELRNLLHLNMISTRKPGQSITCLSLPKTPVRTPQANALCERLLGTLRRECLDFVIPLTAHHVQRLLAAWVPHYNQGRPHMSLGPGLPQPPPSLPVTLHAHRHRLPDHRHVVARSVVGGLHHEYGLAAQVA